MKYIILDLEATCWATRTEKQSEIIEIGAVEVNADRQLVSEFCEFVKPEIHPQLSDFCIELTTITQQQVDDADHFTHVIERFKEWIGVGQSPYMLCSWGFYDRKKLEEDCQRFGHSIDWLRHHISVKHQHGKFSGLKRPVGMGRALAYENIPLDGTHHRGIDDARNITKIFLKYFDQWVYPE